MFVFDFLNDNDGAIITIATLVLVCITLWYVIETMRMRRTTQEMLKISNTPDVQVSIVWEYRSKKVSTYDLCIQNIGTGFAYDLKFSGNIISLRIPIFNERLDDYEIIKDGISVLGPGKRYQFPLFWRYDWGELDLPKEIYVVNVSYMDSAQNPKNGTFHLDFTKGGGYPQIDDPSLESIARSLQGIDYNLLEIKKKYTPDSDTQGMNSVNPS